MSIIQKLQLKKHLKRFYKTFGAELHRAPFTIKLRDFNSYDFLHDIQFDVLQALEAYEDHFYEEAYSLSSWLNKLYNTLENAKEKYYERPYQMDI